MGQIQIGPHASNRGPRLQRKGIAKLTTGATRILQDAVPARFGEGRLWYNWKMYQFSYPGSTREAPWGELSVLEDAQLGFHQTDHFVSYLFQDDPELKRSEGVVSLDEPFLLLLLSTTNSAHSLCELNSFLLFYRSLGERVRVGVCSVIVDQLPRLFDILLEYVPSDDIVILDANTIYDVRKVWLRRNTHMNSIDAYDTVSYETSDNTLVFRDLSELADLYLEDVSLLTELAARKYREHPDRENLPKKIMLVKTADDRVLTTPGRAMTLPPNVRGMLETAGIRVYSIGDFANLDDYLATLYGAEVFITSYGGAACTNRFFCSPTCRVILLAHRHYAGEYRYPDISDVPRIIEYELARPGVFWHLRSTHLFPVAEQLVVLDHNNIVDVDDAKTILSLMDRRVPVSASQGGRIASS